MRTYPYQLPSDKALDQSSESYATDKWSRAHEKKRLRAYLKGDIKFAHGRRPSFPSGFTPIMWPVIETK